MLYPQLKLTAIALLLSPIALSRPAEAAITNSCSIKAGPNNPLAMRANFTLEEQDGNTVTVKYNAAPSPVNADQPIVIFSSIQTLTFNNSTIAQVRDRMLKDPQYFKLLTQFPEDTAFKPFNDALTCTKNISETPKRTSIDQLADGDYRVWNQPSAGNVTDQQILDTGEGGGIFLFNKKGNSLTGVYSRPDDVAYCVTGTLTNGKLTGKANPIDRSSPRPADNSTYDPKGHLKFGQWKGSDRSGASEGTVLDLTSFNRINLGPRKAPSSCR